MKHFQWKNHHNGRYYLAFIQKDLLGDWIVKLCWGKKHTSLGRCRYRVFENEHQARKYLEKIDKFRYRHGYVRVSPFAKMSEKDH